MTMGSRSAKGADGRTGPGGDDEAEAVLSQALRAMAGGRKDRASPPTASYPAGGDGERRAGPRLTAAQIVLVAAIVGIVVGMAVAFAQLLG
jgi:hypothetical protein